MRVMKYLFEIVPVGKQKEWNKFLVHETGIVNFKSRLVIDVTVSGLRDACTNRLTVRALDGLKLQAMKPLACTSVQLWRRFIETIRLNDRETRRRASSPDSSVRMGHVRYTTFIPGDYKNYHTILCRSYPTYIPPT